MSTSEAGTVPVVVVGAGPTGITAATLLAQHGVDVLVLDRWAEVYPQPRAVHLDDEIYRVLARMCLADEFAAISRPSHGLRLLDAEHRTLAEFRRNEGAGRHGFPQANMFDQPELEALLRRNLASQPRITFRGDVEVVGIHQGGIGPVRIELSDRTTGERESVLATYVLGCDGANSIVRSALGSPMRDLGFEQRWLVVDINTDEDLQQWEGVHQVCDTDRAATYMRISDRRYRWEFQLQEGETVADFEDIARLVPLLRPWTGEIPSSALEVVRVTEYTFRAQLADRWRHRNVFILGDAAHLTPPFIGQGMGAGIRDAANLSWKLAAVLQGAFPATVLDSYETERRAHARAMIQLAVLVGRSMTGGGPFGNLLRRVVVPLLPYLPGLRGRVLDSATPALTASTANDRRRLGRGLAGSLCPNAHLGSGCRLDDLAGPRFTLVHRTPLDPAAAAHLTLLDVCVVDAARSVVLDRWLGPAQAALVRPDRTVLVDGRLEAVLRRLPHPRRVVTRPSEAAR